MKDIKTSVKQKHGVSEINPRLRRRLERANLLPDDYEKILNLLPDNPFNSESVESDRLLFQTIIEKLPPKFINYFPWVKAILDNDSSIENRGEKVWYVRWTYSNSKSKGVSDFAVINELCKEIRVLMSFRAVLDEIVKTLQESLIDNDHDVLVIKNAMNKVNSPSYQSAKGMTPEEVSNSLEKMQEMLRQRAQILLKNLQIIPVINLLTGIIETKDSEKSILSVLINEKIDTRRIKKCEQCKDFFWLLRISKEAETTACASCRNLSRQKRFQEKNKDEIKIQRRKNYYYKNSVPFCEKCVRPNSKCDCYRK